MRRPPSYSDSFLVISPRYKLNYEEELLEPPPVEPPVSWVPVTLLFAFKGSFHILCISIFETTFYFLYVNRSEDKGIFNTINTYYNPLVQDCSTQWSNGTKCFIRELLTYSINQTAVDAAGVQASVSRQAYNDRLILQSSLYSVGCLIVCMCIVGIFIYKQWPVSWVNVCTENLLFIGVLAAYEFFFYNTIIYKYTTLSTQELNKYIVDGLASCSTSRV